MTARETIPLLDLSQQNGPLEAELEAAIMRVVRSNHFIMGEEVTGFEAEVARFLGVEHAIGVSSGTDALLVALMALGIGPGDEVITSPYSFFATAGCIVRVGARPVFVDVDEESYNIDPALIEAAITKRTRAIMPVHLFGQAADLARLSATASAHGLPLIEDAAQSFGAHGQDAAGKPLTVGGIGALGCYSFFPSKNIGCFGDGGLVVARDKALADRVRILRVHGAEPRYFHKFVGGNFRLDALQAAVLRVKLPHLAEWIRGRQENAARYDRWFAEAGLSPSRLRTPRRFYAGHIYNQYTIATDVRDGLREHLKAEGIGCEVYYPLPLHLQECFKDLGHRAGAFPRAERAARQALSLPVYAELGEARQRRVVETVVSYLARAS